MDAVTTESKPAHPRTQRPIPAQDPDHDIDAKKTVIALVASTLFVFVTVWILHIVFGRVVFEQRQNKVDQAPTTQLETLRAQEQADLSQKGGIEKSMQDYVQKSNR